jgi:hypothetical protein
MRPIFLEVFEILSHDGRRTFAACEAHDTLPTGVVHAWKFDGSEWYCDGNKVTTEIMTPEVVAALYLHHGTVLDDLDPQARWSAAFVCGQNDFETGSSDLCFAFLRVIGGGLNLTDQDVKAYNRGRKQALQWQTDEREIGPYNETFHVKQPNRSDGFGPASSK